MNKNTLVRSKTEIAILAVLTINKFNTQTGRDNTRVFIANPTWRILQGGNRAVDPMQLFEIGLDMLAFGWGLMVTARGAVAGKVDSGEKSKRLTSVPIQPELNNLDQLAQHIDNPKIKLFISDEDDPGVIIPNDDDHYEETGDEIVLKTPEAYIRALAKRLPIR